MQRSFNRTFMELKYNMSDKANSNAASFNRTFMELKLLTWRTVIMLVMF